MAIDERAARDPFIRQFFERIPADLRGTFTSPQLAALKMVFGESTGAGHMVDLRFDAPSLLRKNKRLYMVILSGLDSTMAANESANAAFSELRPAYSNASSWL